MSNELVKTEEFVGAIVAQLKRLFKLTDLEVAKLLRDIAGVYHPQDHE